MVILATIIAENQSFMQSKKENKTKNKKRGFWSEYIARLEDRLHSVFWQVDVRPELNSLAREILYILYKILIYDRIFITTM